MSVDKDFVLSALLQYNFLPTQKRAREEVPPIYTSVAFTPGVAKKLVAGKKRKSDGYHGFDAVDYKLTRFNGVSRSCSIPHPTPYASLAIAIHEHWDKLEYITTNKNSYIRPRTHSDGRLIIMDYERSFEATRRTLVKAFGRRFMVHTDIANCFPSVYSHALPWAAVGFAHAKKHKSPKHSGEWFNVLDLKLRSMKRGETQGVAIGPATSNIVSEAILARIDETLSKEFLYVRFIDDYTAYCTNEDQAQEFIRRLSQELAACKMLLNINKTAILPLPQALSNNWTSELSLALPRGGPISGSAASSFLTLAMRIANDVPDGSVHKYALKALIRSDLSYWAANDVLRYGIMLAYHQPVLIPLLGELFERTLLGPSFGWGSELQEIALENAKSGRSDGMVWTVHYLNRYSVKVSTEVADAILASRDCLALLTLYLSEDPVHQTKVIAFAKNLDASDLYELDQYWMLLYHLFREGKIPSPYADEDGFEIMRDEGVTFVQNDTADLPALGAKNLERMLKEIFA